MAIPEKLNMDTITLEEALFFLFNLPRVVGVDEMEMRLKQILEDLVHIYKLKQNITH